MATGTREVIAELTPRAEAVREYALKELGPKPDEKSPAEARLRVSASCARPS